MRADIVPGAVFPDYELPDHTTKRRKLSELQGKVPLILVLSRGGSCPKERQQPKGFVHSIVSLRSATAGWSRLAPTVLLGRMNTAPELAPTGLFCPMQGVWSKKISTLLSTRIRSTIP